MPIEQLSLTLSTPVIPVCDPNVTEIEKPRLKTHTLTILARLREGPATNHELDKLTSWRFSGRIYDLRRAGFQITTEHDRASGVAVYSLVSEPCA